MNRLINTPRLAVLAFLGGALFAAAQLPPDTNAPAANPPVRNTPRPESSSLDARVQQLVSTQFARVMTEEQRVKYREAMDANREKMQAIQVKLRAVRKEMLELQLAETFDEAAFHTKAESAAKLQAEVELLNAQAFAQVRPSMTAEQIDKIKAQPFVNRAYGGAEARPGVFPAGVELHNHAHPTPPAVPAPR